MGRRGFSLNRSGRPRRPMDWIVGDMDSTSSQAANPTPFCDWLCDPVTMAEQFTDPTLMATRVAIHAAPQSSPPSSLHGFGFGIIAWNFATDAAGAALMPQCPRLFGDTCQDEDWIFKWLSPRVTGDDSVSGNGGADSVIESKARRRLGNDKGILLVVQTMGSIAFDYHAHVRCLIKE